MEEWRNESERIETITDQRGHGLNVGGNLLVSEQLDLFDCKSGTRVCNEVLQNGRHDQRTWSESPQSAGVHVKNSLPGAFNESETKFGPKGGTWKVPINVRRTVQKARHLFSSRVCSYQKLSFKIRMWMNKINDMINKITCWPDIAGGWSWIKSWHVYKF